MNEWQVARPYAEGYFTSAQRKGNAKQQLVFMTFVADAIKTNDFYKMITHPLIPLLNKQKVLKSLAESAKIKWCEDAWQAVVLLIKHKRVSQLKEMRIIFERLYHRSEGHVVGKLSYAYPLKPIDKAKITKWLESRTACKAKMVYTKDESLIGGFKLLYNDDVWDASLKSHLKRVSLNIKSITTMF